MKLVKRPLVYVGESRGERGIRFTYIGDELYAVAIDTYECAC